MGVYIINVRVTRNNIDDISHRAYFMGYVATIGVIIYWKPDQHFVIHRAHHVWFDEYNSRVSIEDNHTPGYLILQKDPEIHIHHSDLLNFIPCELDITYNPLFDTKVLTSEI